MRLRPLALWIVVPPVFIVAASCWFVERSVASERERVGARASVAMQGEAFALASGYAASETMILLGLDAFTTRPLEFELYEASSASMRADLDPTQLLRSLSVTETEGAQALRQLDAVTTVDPSVQQVLSPLDQRVRERLAIGEHAVIDPAAYVDASAWLRDRSNGAQTRAADSTAELARLAQRRAYWRDAGFIGFAATLMLLATGGGLAAYARVTGSARRLAERVDAERARADVLHERSEQFRTLIGLARRLTAETETTALARALVAETRAVVGHDVGGVALMLRDGNTMVPLMAIGDIAIAAIGGDDSVVNQCVATGTVSRRVVPNDPAFPGEVGPLSVIGAPLVAEAVVIGAMVAVTRRSALFDENDEVAMQLIALVAAGAVQSAQRYHSTLAMTLHDPLTGLANRRRLDRDLAAAMASGSEPVAFLMIDVDHFKAFNDRYGHVAGDGLLKSVATAISAAVRESDVVYRFGGEEFSVLLPQTDATVAMVIAERVRDAVANAPAPAGTDAVTVSVGVASGTADSLVGAADAALYRAKQAGRDRIMVAP